MDNQLQELQRPPAPTERGEPARQVAGLCMALSLAIGALAFSGGRAEARRGPSPARQVILQDAAGNEIGREQSIWIASGRIGIPARAFLKLGLPGRESASEVLLGYPFSDGGTLFYPGRRRVLRISADERTWSSDYGYPVARAHAGRVYVAAAIALRDSAGLLAAEQARTSRRLVLKRTRQLQSFADPAKRSLAPSPEVPVDSRDVPGAIRCRPASFSGCQASSTDQDLCTARPTGGPRILAGVLERIRPCSAPSAAQPPRHQQLLGPAIFTVHAANAAERKVVTPSVTPRRHAGQSYVAVGLIGAMTGAPITRHPDPHEVDIQRGDRHVRLRVGSRTALVNDQRVPLAVAPYLHEGNMMVPLRRVAEALKVPVQYEEQTTSLLVGPGADGVLWTVPLESRRTGIVIHSPKPGAVHRKQVHVHGQANTPDSSVVVQLQSAEGEVLQQSVVPRTRGTFQAFTTIFTHASSSGGARQVRIVAFSPSPENGTPRYRVAIPITLHLTDSD